MKNAILYRLQQLLTFPQVEQEYRAPEGNEWRTLTFYNLPQGWMMARITERVLPSAAITRYVAIKAAEFLEQTDQKATRTQKARWKEDYIDKHLPTAPLRDIMVPLYHNDDYLFVGTVSQATADLVTGELRYNVFDGNLSILLCDDANRIVPFLKDLLEGNTDYSLGDKYKFMHEDRRISFAGEMAEDLATDFYKIHNPRPIQVQFASGDNHLIATLNEKGRFSGLNYDAGDEDDEGEAAKLFFTGRMLDELGNIMDTCYEDDTL